MSPLETLCMWNEMKLKTQVYDINWPRFRLVVTLVQ